MDAILTTLGLNLSGFLWHTLNFAILVFLLWRVLYKPVTAMLDERARRVTESLARAEEVERQSKQAEADRQALLVEMRREAETIRANADEQAKRIIATAQLSAQDEANAILQRARTEIESSRQQMMADVRSHVADLVVSAVDRVTRQALDARSQQALIQQFLATETSGLGSGPSGGAAVRR